MTFEQEAHLNRIKRQSDLEIDLKYRKGQAEHGGNLFDMPLEQLVKEAIDENTDQRVFLVTIQERLNKAVDNCTCGAFSKE